MRFRLIAAVALLAACGGGGSDLGLYAPDELTSREDLLAARREIRAYDGAPPVIPHEVSKRGRQDCNGCHTPGSTDNAERVGPPRSHPAWGDCRQCHVESVAARPWRENELEPLWWPAYGTRQSEIAPPTIPHMLQNREDCAVCHIGEQAAATLRAGHGLRPNCRQCHVPVW